MFSLPKHQDWIRLRRRLEKEIRVLVLEINPKLRSELENLFYRCRLSARAVPSEGQARKLLGQGHYPLVVVPEVLPGMNGTALIRQLQDEFPDVDFVLTTKSPSLELVSWAFDLGVRDVVRRPVADPEQVADQLRLAARRNVERRVRKQMLRELKEIFETQVARLVPGALAELNRRLDAFKQHLGAADRVLVVEQTTDVRPLAESLFVAGLAVETVPDLDAALLRAARGDLNLILLETSEEPGEVAGLMESIHDADPQLQTVLVAAEPEVAGALQALRLGAALHLPMLPETHDLLVDRIRDILQSSRRKRLLDNLLAEMFVAAVRGLTGAVGEADLDVLRELTGLGLSLPLDYVAEERAGTKRDTLRDSASYLDRVLDEINPAEGPAGREYPRVADEALSSRGAERRVHERLPSSHFIRFREQTSPSSILAYLGNLSRGGLFVRTPVLLARGTRTEVDFNVECAGQGYRVCCGAEVVWKVESPDEFPLAPGFGVRLVDPPADVTTLLDLVAGSGGTGATDPAE